MNANTTETDIETQPPWDLIALLVLAFIVLGWMALAVSYNPSRGAQHTFESLHSVVLPRTIQPSSGSRHSSQTAILAPGRRSTASTRASAGALIRRTSSGPCPRTARPPARHSR